MTEETIKDRFLSFVRAQYNGVAPEDLPKHQELAVEDAFYAGAQIGFLMGLGATDEEAIAIREELKDFSARIIERYREAGLLEEQG